MIDRYLTWPALLTVWLLTSPATAQLIVDPNFFCSGDPCIVTAELDVLDGAVVDFLGRDLIVRAKIDADLSFVSLTAGSLTVEGAGQFKARGTFDNAGGEFEILVSGDVILNSDGWAFLLEGDSGGELTIESELGSITGSGMMFNSRGLTLGEDAGTITLTAALDVVLTGDIQADGGPDGGFGGDIDVAAGRHVVLGGSSAIFGPKLILTGGGEITIDAEGDVTLRQASLDGNDGPGGTITVAAGASIIIVDELSLRGSLSSGGNSGGVVDLDAFDGAIRVTPTGSIDLDGRGDRGCGGELAMDATTISIEALVTVNGGSGQSCGGTVDLLGDRSIVIAAGGRLEIESGDSTGFLNPQDPNRPLPGPGLVDLISFGKIDVFGPIIADAIIGSDGAAGSIDLDADGPLQITSEVMANGRLGGFGGVVFLQGCQVDVTSTAEVETRREGGDIVIQDGDQMVLAGSLDADGTIELLHTAAKPPIVTGADFNRSTVVTRVSSTLPNCDIDGDLVLNFFDNCPRTVNPDQLDSGGLGFATPPGGEGDGIGDVCQCGDVSGDGIVDATDELLMRQAMAGILSILEPERCNVWEAPADISSQDSFGVTPDCGLNDVTVLSRALAGDAPGLQQVCAPATLITP